MRIATARSHEAAWRRQVICGQYSQTYAPRLLRGVERFLLVVGIAMLVTLVDMACVSGFATAAWHVVAFEWQRVVR